MYKVKRPRSANVEAMLELADALSFLAFPLVVVAIGVWLIADPILRRRR